MKFVFVEISVLHIMHLPFVETYPMPKIEDMHSALRGCTVFGVVDMKQAYYQIPLSKESQK